MHVDVSVYPVAAMPFDFQLLLLLLLLLLLSEDWTTVLVIMTIKDKNDS